MKKLSSPVRRFGGKAKVVTRILEHFVPHREYIEPFFGAGSVFFAKDPAKLETINDLDGDVHNFFTVLRDNPQEFQHLALLTPYSRELYYECKEAWPKEIDPIRRAWMWWVISLQSFGGGDFSATGWRKLSDAKTRRSVAVEIWSKVEGLERVCARLRFAQIENAPAIKVIQQYTTKTSLCYCDPPYHPSTRVSDAKYSFEMTNEQHGELIDLLLKSPGKIILSGYDCEAYAPLERAGWKKVEWVTKDSTSRSESNERLQRVECLWINQMGNLEEI